MAEINMICPVCRTDAEPAGVAGPIAICAQCGSTAAIEADGKVRRATIRDIEALNDEQVQALREARRGKVRRR